MALSLRLLILATVIGGLAAPVPAADLVGHAPPEGKGKPPKDDEPTDPGDGGDPPTTDPVLQSWMDPDIGLAWGAGLTGAGSAITFVDDFSSRSKYRGDLGLGRDRLRHGEWTSLQGSLVAPGALIFEDDFIADGNVTIKSDENGDALFNIFNLSYGWIGGVGNQRDIDDFDAAAQEQSILTAATNDAALISKSAGNDGDLFTGTHYVVGQPVGQNLDYLGAGLVDVITTYRTTGLDGYFYVDDMGTTTTDDDVTTEFAPIIFAGSLDTVGYPDGGEASLSYYSNVAGSDVNVQDHFVVIGVDYGLTDLAGTSFAAPILSGYAAIVANKFKNEGALPAPSKVAAQLLVTAREDTVAGYNAYEHGQGEACLGCALGVGSLK